MPARRGNVGDPTTRNALLDAAQELMLDEGHAAVTTRRLAAKAGVTRFLLFEEAFDVDIGHADTERIVERHIRDLEGDRSTDR